MRRADDRRGTEKYRKGQLREWKKKIQRMIEEHNEP